MPVARDRDADGRVVQDGLALHARALAGAHIARVDDDVVATVHHEARRRHAHRDAAAALADKVHRQVGHGPVLAHLLHKGLTRRVAAPDAQFQRRVAHGLGGAPTAHALEGLVDHDVAASVHVGERDEVGAGGHQVRQHGLGPAHRLFGGQPFRHVDVDRQQRRATLRRHAHTGVLHRECLALHPQLEVRYRQRRAIGHGQHLLGAAARTVTRVTAFVGQQQIGAQHADQRGEAEQRQRGRVGVQHAAMAVQHQRRGDAREQLLVARLGGLQRGARGLHRGDIARHAPVALEDAARIKTRLTAGQVGTLAAVAIAPGEGQVAEGRAGFQVGHQHVQRVGLAGKPRQFPRHHPQAGVHLQRAQLGVVLAGSDDAVLAVDLPIGVGGQRQQAPETLLTRVGGLHGLVDDTTQHHASGQADGDGYQVRAQQQGR